MTTKWVFMLELLIETLGSELNIKEQIRSKDRGGYAIQFDSSNLIEISLAGDIYLLSCLIAPLPEKNAEALISLAMEGNLFGQATHGAVLGLNEEGKLLTLTEELQYNTTYKEFKEKLEDFLNVADFWRAKTEKLQ